jgi:ribonucleotide monophosphatase NagD (HAD superfamily)
MQLLLVSPNLLFFELAAQDFEFKANEIAMVGDDLINDIQGAQNMGYITFLVKTGKFRSSIYKSSSIRPDHLIKSINQLPNYILTNSLI